MTVLVADRGANASVLAAAVAAMVALAFAASVGLYIVAASSQPMIGEKPAPKPMALKPVLALKPVRMQPIASAKPVAPPKVAPHADWMDRSIAANP